MRNQPIYFLIDSSGSMNGAPINSVNVGIRRLLNSLQRDPHALETYLLSIITFDREVNELFALTEIHKVEFKDIIPPKSGGAHMGEALKFLLKRYDIDFKKKNNSGERNYLPMLFIITDGKPSDLQLFEEMAMKIKSLEFSSIIAFLVGSKPETNVLKKITENVLMTEGTSLNSIEKFFKWVSPNI